MRSVVIFLGLVVAAVGLLFLACAGWNFVFEIPAYLAAGWVLYLGRVAPQWNPDPAALVTAAVCLVGVVVGGHMFFRWLYAHTSDSPRRWPWRWTLRIVGLVVLMFVAGIAVTGLVHQATWLARTPEPLVRGRDHAQSASRNNLKQIGLAAYNYADAMNHLPRSSFDSLGRPVHSWQTELLPFVEQTAVHAKIDFRKPWTHPANAPAMQEQLRVFTNYSYSSDTVNGYGVSHYAGNARVVMGDRPKKLADFPQGASNTIFAGEVSANFRAWGDPRNARDPRLGVGHPDGFGAKDRRPLFAVLDGSVRSFDPKELAEVIEMSTK